jgi:ubiquinone/menaquinone biosynthesis C-methylase UbiE
MEEAMKLHKALMQASMLLISAGLIGLSTGHAQLQQQEADKYIESMEKPTRVVKVQEVIEKLELKPGDIVADIGSAAGTFSIPMAKAIAPNGILYAVDIDQKMLDYVAAKAKKEGVTNIVTVLGEYDDPKLPVKNVDVAFYHRVLHMIEHRQTHINATAKYLKPDGKIVVIDKNHEDSPDSWMWLNQSDVDTWMAAISFYPAQKFAVFDDRYFVVYQRPYGKSILLKKKMPGDRPKD